MSNILEQASLVVVPSGYKEDKIYSQIPIDGDGDLQFTRASNATRVNSAGLIEKVRTNLVLYSEEFDNAAWVKTRTDVTANDAVAPDGTTTADKIIETVASGAHFISQNIASSAAENYTFSVYAKKAEKDIIQITFGTSNVSGNPFANFDLSSGVISNFGFSQLSLKALPNNWYKIEITVIAAGATLGAIIALVPSAASVRVDSYTGDGTSGIFIWGAQLEVSDFGATDYIPTTTAAVSVGMTADVPRLDYLGSSCPSLLLEPQRTNLLQFSEQFDNAYWTKTRINTTGTPPWVNVGVAPNGTTAAEKIIANTDTGGAHAVTSTAFNSTVAAYTASIFVKSAEFSRIRIRESNGLASATYNLANQTFTLSTGTSANITSLANDWYRISVTFSYASILSSSIAFDIVDNSGNTTFAGNDSDGIFIWGAQLEVGSYPTSYIPTLGTSVTRVADAASKTGISSLIGQTQGTLFVEINKSFAEAGERYIAISDGTVNNRIMFLGSVGGNIRGFITTSGIGVFDFTSAQSAIGTHRIAIAYANNDVIMYIDGVQVASSISVAIPAVGNLYIGTSEAGGVSPLNGGAAQALLFKTRLSNTELAQLTTL